MLSYRHVFALEWVDQVYVYYWKYDKLKLKNIEVVFLWKAAAVHSTNIIPLHDRIHFHRKLQNKSSFYCYICIYFSFVDETQVNDSQIYKNT